MTPQIPEATPEGAREASEGPQAPDLGSLDAFTLAYIQAALWSSTDYAGHPLDKSFTAEDIAPETLLRMSQDCAQFQRGNRGYLIDRDAAFGGHDFWLTRNGHGAGFWDGDWPELDAKHLTRAAHAFGSFDLYVGDDGRVYGS